MSVLQARHAAAESSGGFRTHLIQTQCRPYSRDTELREDPANRAPVPEDASACHAGRLLGNTQYRAKRTVPTPLKVLPQANGHLEVLTMLMPGPDEEPNLSRELPRAKRTDARVRDTWLERTHPVGIRAHRSSAPPESAVGSWIPDEVGQAKRYVSQLLQRRSSFLHRLT